jgi:hypothetical protein
MILLLPWVTVGSLAGIFKDIGGQSHPTGILSCIVGLPRSLCCPWHAISFKFKCCFSGNYILRLQQDGKVDQS